MKRGMNNMRLTQFIKTYLGKKVGSGQCVALARQYIEDVLEVPQFPALGEEGGAREIIDKCNNLNVTLDSVTADYSVGDILVWDSSRTNKYGHVGILVGIYNTKYFWVMEQDGFKQDGVKITLRSRENLRGALWK